MEDVGNGEDNTPTAICSGWGYWDQGLGGPSNGNGATSFPKLAMPLGPALAPPWPLEPGNPSQRRYIVRGVRLESSGVVIDSVGEQRCR